MGIKVELTVINKYKNMDTTDFDSDLLEEFVFSDEDGEGWEEDEDEGDEVMLMDDDDDMDDEDDEEEDDDDLSVEEEDDEPDFPEYVDEEE